MTKIKKLSNPFLLAVLAVLLLAVAFCGFANTEAQAEGTNLSVSTTLDVNEVDNSQDRTITVSYGITANTGINSFVASIAKPEGIHYSVTINEESQPVVSGITASSTWGLGEATLTGSGSIVEGVAGTQTFAYESATTSSATPVQFLSVTYVIPADFPAGEYSFGLTNAVAYLWVGGGSSTQTAISLNVNAATLKVRNVGTINISDGEQVYNGSNAGYTVNESNYNGDGAISTTWYQEDGETPLEGVPTNVGTYKFTASAPQTATYTAVTKTVTYTIKPAYLTLAANDITITASKPYTGSAIAWVVSDASVSDTSGASVTAVSGGGTDVADDYIITVTLTADANHTFTVDGGVAAAGNTKDFSKTVAIVSVENSFTTGLSMSGWTYNAEPATPSAVAKFGEVVFSYSADNVTFQAECFENVGNYWVKAYVAGTENYDEISEVVTFSINPALVTVSANEIVAAAKTYTGSALSWIASDISISKTGVESVTAVAENSFTNANTAETPAYSITVTLKATSNYTFTEGGIVANAGNTVQIPDVSAVVNKATNQFNPGFIASYDKAWDGELIVFAVDSNFGEVVITYSDGEGTYVADQFTDAGTYYAKAVVVGTDNYTALEEIKEYTISRVQLSYTSTAFVYTASKPYTGSEVVWVEGDIKTLPDYVTFVSGQTLPAVESGNIINVGAVKFAVTFRADENHYFVNVAGNDTAVIDLPCTIAQATNTWITGPTGGFNESANPKYTAVPQFGTTVFAVYTARTGTEGNYVFDEANKIENADTYNFQATGTYYFRYLVVGTANYTGLDSSALVSFNFISITPDVKLADGVTVASIDNSLTYNGTNQVFVVPNPATCHYSSEFSNDGIWTNASAVAYTLTLTLHTDTDYVWSDGTTAAKTYTATISAKAITLTTVSVTKTYGDAFQQPVLTAESLQAICEADRASALDNVYTLFVKDGDTVINNLNATQYLPGVYAFELTGISANYIVTPVTDGTNYTIQAATLTEISVAQTGTLTYTGNAQRAVVAATATGVDGVASFTYCDASADSQTFTADVPEYTNKGNYTVNYKATLRGHNDATGTFTITMAAGVVTRPIADPTVFVFNNADQTYSIATGTLYSYSLVDATKKNAGSYNVVVSLNDDSNYTWDDATTADLTFVFKIEKYGVAVTANDQTAVYTGSEPTVDQSAYTLYKTGGGDVDAFVNSVITGVTISKSAGTAFGGYALVPSNAKLAEGVEVANYEISYVNGSFSITKAPNTVTFDGMAASSQYKQALPHTAANVVSAIYTDEDHPLVFQFSDTENGTYTDTVPVNVGNYWVKASVSESGNYLAGSAKASFSITTVALADIVVNFTSNNTLEWADIVLDENGVAITCTVSYSVNEVATANRELTATAAETYTVKAIPSDTLNYTGSEYQIVAYSATFNGGSHEASPTTFTAPEVQYIFNNQAVNAPAALSTEKDAVIIGYAFKFWALSTKTDSAYNFETLVTGNIVIEAQWDINKYLVTIAKNENTYGAVSKDSVENVDYGTIITVDGNKITINGTEVVATPSVTTSQYSFSFDSWTLPADNKVVEAVTVTANFERAPISYQLTVMVTDGAGVTAAYGDATSVAYGTALSLPVIPAKDWFTVSAWYSDPEMTTLLGENPTMPAEDSIVYAAYNFSIGKGDIDGSGTIDADDLTLYRRYIVGGYSMTIVEPTVAACWAIVNDAGYNIDNVYFLKATANVDSLTSPDAFYDICDLSVVHMAMLGGYGLKVEAGSIQVSELTEADDVENYYVHAGESSVRMTEVAPGSTEYKATVTITENAVIGVYNAGEPVGTYKAAINYAHYAEAASHTFIPGTYDVYYQTGATDPGIYVDSTVASISAVYNGSTYCKGSTEDDELAVSKANVLVTSTRTNNITVPVTAENFSVGNVDMTAAAGPQAITVTMGDFSTTITVTLIDPVGGYNGYTLLGIGGNWLTGTALRYHNDNEGRIFRATFNGTDGVKVYHQGNYINIINNDSSVVQGSFDPNGNMIIPAGTYDLYYTYSSGVLYIGQSTFAVHFYNNLSDNGTDAVMIHAWTSDIPDIERTGAWGSSVMTNEDGTNYHVYRLDDRATNIIFALVSNNGYRSEVAITLTGDIWVKDGMVYYSQEEADNA